MKKSFCFFLLIAFGFFLPSPAVAQDEDSLTPPGCGTGFKPFDLDHQMWFDSCFRSPAIKGHKRCHVTIKDSMFTTGKKESIEVSFDDRGRPAQLLHVVEDIQKSTCAEITCAYGNSLFYSRHAITAEPNRTGFYRQYKRADGKYREETTWEWRSPTGDTMGTPTTKRCVYSNAAGKDSCIQFTSSFEKWTMFLTKTTMLNDSMELRIYKHVTGRAEKGDSTEIQVTVTYNQRQQPVRKEQYIPKSRDKAITMFRYDEAGRLTRYAYANNSGNSEGFAIERDKSGLPVKIRCVGFLYHTIYSLKWD